MPPGRIAGSDIALDPVCSGSTPPSWTDSKAGYIVIGSYQQLLKHLLYSSAILCQDIRRLKLQETFFTGWCQEEYQEEANKHRFIYQWFNKFYKRNLYPPDFLRSDSCRQNQLLHFGTTRTYPDRLPVYFVKSAGWNLNIYPELLMLLIFEMYIRAAGFSNADRIRFYKKADDFIIVRHCSR